MNDHRRTINILYLEDSSDDREIFSDIFEELNAGIGTDPAGMADGYYVECVPTIQSALFSLGIKTFDVLFVDYVLMGRHGERNTSQELLQDLITQALRIPVVITTGYPKSAVDEEYLNLLPPEQRHFMPKADWSPESLRKMVQGIVETPLKLLYLEDTEEDVELVRDLLGRVRKYHFEMDVADTVEQARHAMQGHRYDILLADLNVHGQLSTELVAELAGNGNAPTVLMVSGMDPRSAQVQALHLDEIDGLEFIPKDALSEAALVNSILKRRNVCRERILAQSV